MPAKRTTPSKSPKKAKASPRPRRKPKDPAAGLRPTERESSGANRCTAATRAAMRLPTDDRAVREGCWFDTEAADRAVNFFQGILRHTTGQFAGKPFELLPWQRDELIRPLFGWKNASGIRRFSRASVWIPKKNGKSTLSGGIALYALCADAEPAAQVYSAAADREQAGIVYREAANMVRASPVLSSSLRIIDSTKRIIFDRANSFYRVLSRDSFTSEGINSHCNIFDELHAQKSRELYDALRYAGAARRQPINIDISTAGIYDLESIGYEQYTTAKQVLAGSMPLLDLLPVVYEAGADDAIDDPATWAKANPSLGHTITVESFARDAEEARAKPSKLNSFKRYRLNQWVQQEFRWITPHDWDECAFPVHEEDLRGRQCFVGVDMANTRDLAPIVYVFPPREEGERWAVLPKFFVPRDAVLERSQRDRVPYDLWVRDGLMTATPGNSTDYQAVLNEINAAGERYMVREVVMDRMQSANLAQRLMDEGFEVTMITPRYSDISPACKFLEKLLADRALAHGGHQVLKWNAMNVAAETDVHENIRPAKSKSTERIDGIVAMLYALARAIAADPEPRGRVLVW